MAKAKAGGGDTAVVFTVQLFQPCDVTLMGWERVNAGDEGSQAVGEFAFFYFCVIIIRFRGLVGWCGRVDRDCGPSRYGVGQRVRPSGVGMRWGAGGVGDCPFAGVNDCCGDLGFNRLQEFIEGHGVGHCFG